MRASRLLQMLLLLQNRGKLTTTQLASELEVAKRTVLRDVDALTEAGLPVVVHRGARGGIELGFNYRTRFTGLSREEAEALGLILATPTPALDALGLDDAARSARSKLLESLPDLARETAMKARELVRFVPVRAPRGEERLLALFTAVRQRRKVRIHAHTKRARLLHPVAVQFGPDGWSLVADDGSVVALKSCGDLNVSALKF
ncbi:MAG: HTH domain-containing protein [Archangium sp.]